MAKKFKPFLAIHKLLSRVLKPGVDPEVEDTPLPEHTWVRLVLGGPDHAYIDVRQSLHDLKLIEVRTHPHSLKIIPASSNQIFIGLADQ